MFLRSRSNCAASGCISTRISRQVAIRSFVAQVAETFVVVDRVSGSSSLGSDMRCSLREPSFCRKTLGAIAKQMIPEKYLLGLATLLPKGRWALFCPIANLRGPYC